MDVPWSAGIACTVRDVVSTLAMWPLARTTVQTVMDRLTEKRLLEAHTGWQSVHVQAHGQPRRPHGPPQAHRPGVERQPRFCAALFRGGRGRRYLDTSSRCAGQQLLMPGATSPGRPIRVGALRQERRRWSGALNRTPTRNMTTSSRFQLAGERAGACGRVRLVRIGSPVRRGRRQADAEAVCAWNQVTVVAVASLWVVTWTASGNARR